MSPTGTTSPLLESVMGPTPECMLVLLKTGADVRDAGNRGDTAVHLLAAFGKGLEFVQPLVAAGIDLDARSMLGGPAMTHAATYNNHIILKYLLKAGANPELISYGDPLSTVLGFAIGFNAHECVEILLEHGVECTMVSDNGETILHRAAERADEETFEIMSRAGLRRFDVTARDSKGLTAEMVFKRRKILSEELKVKFEWLISSITQKDMVSDERRIDEDDVFEDANEYQLHD